MEKGDKDLTQKVTTFAHGICCLSVFLKNLNYSIV